MFFENTLIADAVSVVLTFKAGVCAWTDADSCNIASDTKTIAANCFSNVIMHCLAHTAVKNEPYSSSGFWLTLLVGQSALFT